MKLPINIALPSEIEVPDDLFQTRGSIALLEAAKKDLEKRIVALEQREAIPEGHSTVAPSAFPRDAGPQPDLSDMEEGLEELKRGLRDLNLKKDKLLDSQAKLVQGKVDCNFSGEYHFLAGLDPELAKSYKNGRDITARFQEIVNHIIKEENGLGSIVLPAGELKAMTTLFVPPGITLKGQGRHLTKLHVDFRETPSERLHGSSDKLSRDSNPGIVLCGQGTYHHNNTSTGREGTVVKDLSLTVSGGRCSGILVVGHLTEYAIENISVSGVFSDDPRVGIGEHTLPGQRTLRTPYGSVVSEETTVGKIQEHSSITNCIVRNFKVGVFMQSERSRTENYVYDCHVGVMHLGALSLDMSQITGKCDVAIYAGKGATDVAYAGVYSPPIEDNSHASLSATAKEERGIFRTGDLLW